MKTERVQRGARRFLVVIVSLFLLAARGARAGWVVLPASDARRSMPAEIPGDAKAIEPGAKWPNDQRFRWIVGDLVIPDTIDKKPAAGRAVGIQFNCGDGGEVWVDGKLRVRYDNDHPALILVSAAAEAGAKVRVAAQVYGKVQGGDQFGEARWVLVEPRRATEPLRIGIDAGKTTGAVPDGLIGLSQGGGMCDYEEATARKLREGGFKWFRMDNVFTGALKRKGGGADAKLEYDWADLDRRVDFIRAVGAVPILAVSYMPQPLDAVPDNERHSAPRDYGAWEELCFRAAARCVERGRAVPFWEVWNEANAGWIKPGPDDGGSDEFAKLYLEALGKEPKNKEIVRRFEAYCKLYRATAKGVRRADPSAKIGGPALASGPFDDSKLGPGANGRGFSRGLMLWCDREKLPLDFVSWHEYFHPAEVIAKEAEEFRAQLESFPELKPRVTSLILSEWNQAWWADRPQDHEVGAAWCADCVTRAFIPHHIDRPCLFYAKQGDDNFRGDYGILMKDNVPKATYNVAKIFNSLSGLWLDVGGTDDEISAVACWDGAKKRLAIVLVNFRYRYGLERRIILHLDHLPEELRGGAWREWTVDATHSNAWHDRSKAELQRTGAGDIDGGDFQRALGANSIMMLELDAPNRQ
jgi:hypothetical protein